MEMKTEEAQRLIDGWLEKNAKKPMRAHMRSRVKVTR